MTSLSPLSLVLRAFATVIVFAVTGPIMIAIAGVIVVAAFGAPFLELFTALTGLSLSRNWLVISVLLFAGILIAGSVLPSLCAGVVFSLLAFAFERSAIAVAWAAAAIVALGFALAGMMMAPSESSPLILVPVASIQQALSFAFLLFVPASLAASVAWFLSRPFHRGVSAA